MAQLLFSESEQHPLGYANKGNFMIMSHCPLKYIEKNSCIVGRRKKGYSYSGKAIQLLEGRSMQLPTMVNPDYQLDCVWSQLNQSFWALLWGNPIARSFEAERPILSLDHTFWRQPRSKDKEKRNLTLTLLALTLPGKAIHPVATAFLHGY